MSLYFHIPDFTMCGAFNLIFLDYKKMHPDYFRPGVEIASVYGSFPSAKWNGGRVIAGSLSDELVAQYIREFNSRKVPLRFTYTNPNITEALLSDPFCNKVTRQAHNGLNEIIVSSALLEDYIRANYPKYPIISSTIKQIEDPDKLEAELDKDYKLVVLDYNWNNDYRKLEKIRRKDKCEILINPYCVPHCARRKEHYRYTGQVQIDYSHDAQRAAEEIRKFKCPYLGCSFAQALGFSTNVKAHDLYSRYVDMGFSNFKIEGRSVDPLNVVESYVYYLVKPDYQTDARMELGNIVNALTEKKRQIAASKPRMAGVPAMR